MVHLSHVTSLILMILMVGGYFLAELIAGHLTDSLALVADSFHMLSDLIALIVALSAIIIARRKRSNKNTFGWIRMEIVGALVNSVILLTLCFTIVTDALERYIKPEEVININQVLIVACIGLVINLLGMLLFASGSNVHSHHHHHHQHHQQQQQKSIISSSPIEPKPIDNAVRRANNTLRQATLNDFVAEHGTGRHYYVDQTISRVMDDLVNSDEDEDSTKISGQSSLQDFAVRIPQSAPAADEPQNPPKRANMNIRGVFLHVLGDALGSVVVIASALIAKYVPTVVVDGVEQRQNWIKYVDPTLSIILAIIMSSTAVGLFKNAVLILLQTVPAHLSTTDLEKELLQEVPEIENIHDFHIWQLNDDKIITSAHVTRKSLTNYMSVASAMKQFFHKRGIHSTTIQVEWEDGRADDDLICLLSCQDENCAKQSCCDVNNGAPTTASVANTQQPTTQNSHRTSV